MTPSLVRVGVVLSLAVIGCVRDDDSGTSGTNENQTGKSASLFREQQGRQFCSNLREFIALVTDARSYLSHSPKIRLNCNVLLA